MVTFVNDTPLKTARLSDPRTPSQLDVARAVGVNQGFYSRLENGETKVAADTAHDLAAYFGLQVADLFTPTQYSSEPQLTTTEA